MQLGAITKLRSLAGSHYFPFTMVFYDWRNINICNIEDMKDEGIYPSFNQAIFGLSVFACTSFTSKCCVFLL